MGSISRFENYGVSNLIMSVEFSIIANLPERKTMCAVCYGNAHGLTSYSIIPNNLCVIHYQEWADEKNAFETFETHDYLELVNL